jgi:MFS family permease
VKTPLPTSPFEIRNIRLFIAFRVCFNSRFYYPVFTILFLDFGLSLQDFAILNAIWAATIVVLEVPSGAMADVVGRKNLLILTGVLMVLEMAILCFVPLGNPGWLFLAFLFNRILSGAAEAAASGADEAIAYDSLLKRGHAKDWPRVLEKQMRMQSIAYIGAMSLGAAVYDPVLVQRLIGLLGIDIQLTQSATLRFPIYLTLIMAVCTLLTALKMQEEHPPTEPSTTAIPSNASSTSATQAFRLTLQAGRWIVKTPFALVVILTGLLFDNCLRMVVTLNSQYYRLIQLPEATFGLIGSGFALLGLFIPRLAREMAERRTPTANFFILVVMALLGLTGMRFFVPVWGLLPVVFIVCVMYMNRFFQSHYLNRITDSHQRATVLSFKGLSFNLAYGMIGILYSLLVALLRAQVTAHEALPDKTAVENLVFEKSLEWFPAYFLLSMVVLILFARLRLKNDRRHMKSG